MLIWPAWGASTPRYPRSGFGSRFDRVLNSNLDEIDQDRVKKKKKKGGDDVELVLRDQDRVKEEERAGGDRKEEDQALVEAYSQAEVDG